VHDLHLLAGLLRGLHLLDALPDAGGLAGPVRPDPDADPREDRHDHGCDHHSLDASHDLLRSRLHPRWRRDVNRS
jgi:hypothetical protein